MKNAIKNSILIAYFLENHEKKYKKPLSQIRFNLNSDNGFCFVFFPVTVADVDILVEMGGVEPPS